MAAALSSRTQLTKLQGLRTSVRRTPVARRPVQVQAFQVKLILEGGKNVTIDCPESTYILDAAEEQGVDLPYSCRAGSCSSCAAKIDKGTVDQSGQSFLTEAQIEQGYILTCIAYPTSDLILKTHVENDLY